jgi:leucyl-tRNA synthetase
MSESKRIDWQSIEQKWIRRWEEEKLFETDPDGSRQKYFVTVAYPYPNSPQHIGHGRTYTLADAHARYMRMKGFNVLFPMGFHYTGTPILGMSRRVAAGDSDLLDTFRKIYKLSDDVISTFVEPVKIASYFHSEIKMGMKEMGYSIDWRREFTTIDPVYSKFISWQFRTLKKKGLIVQGSHPVGWCPRDQNPVSQHDTMGDVEPDFTEYTLVKFRSGNKVYPAATLRPETLFGVTNMWVNPGADYVESSIDGELWVVSTEAARKLEFLNHKVEIKSTVKGKNLVGLELSNPLTGTSVPVYPASFVEPDSGTGVVMSVPAHAPYDYQALEDLRADAATRAEFNISKVASPIKIIESEGYTGIPAAEAISKSGASSQNDKLEVATDELYSHEFYKGKMMDNTGKYSGVSVSIAKNAIKEEIVQSGHAGMMYELVNKPVKCRCGTECAVKLLTDQWFLNYGDKDWKAAVHECAREMDIVPQDIRPEFDYVIDWLRERACARKTGLGTKLPWDPEWIIESLSDSVIYMAYYTLAKYVNSGAISESSLADPFFDYVLLGIGSAEAVSKESGIDASTIDQVRSEFRYFYPVDSRHSGRDLVPNHLTFFIFNHVAIFGRDNWPKQIVVNGSVLMEGKKMSKSLGNIIPLRAAILEHGADTIRVAMLVSAEILQDADFSFDTVRGIRSKLAEIFDLASFCSGKNDHRPPEPEDRWLLSRLQRIISETSSSMEKLRMREAIHHILYSLDQDRQWYLKRTNAKGNEGNLTTLSECLEVQVRLLAPFAPFTSDEIWERMGKRDVTLSGWPVVRQEAIDLYAEESEFLISSLLTDLQSIVKVTKIVPKKIVLYTCSPWKTMVYRVVLSQVLEGKTNFGEIMKILLSDPQTVRAKTDPKLVQKMMEDILSSPLDARYRRIELTGFDESSALRDASSLISTENNKAEIMIYSEEDVDRYDPRQKSKFARPFKPAVFME